MVSFTLTSFAAFAVLSHGAQASPELRVPKQTADVVATAVSSQTTAPPAAELVQARQATSAFSGTVLIAPDNVCGYISGDASSPWSCDTTDKCGFATESGGWAACCRGTACSISQVACIDRAAYLTSSLCNSACANDIGTRKCTATSLPYCGTLTFFNGIVDYRCEPTNSSTFAQVESTYDGQSVFASGATAYMLTTIVYGAQSTYTLRSSSSSTLSSTSAPPTTTSESSTAVPNNGGGGGSSTPIGAIVGGVVGGVAVIALIAFGIWFMKSRQKKKANTAETQAMMSQNTGAGGPHGGPHGGPAMAQAQSPYSTGTGYAPSNYPQGTPYTGAAGMDPNGSPAMAGGYYQDPNQQGYVPSVSPDPNRQSYQQGPVPAAWAQHTGNSGHQVSQHTGSSGTGAHPQFAQHSGGQQQQQPTTYYEASGVPMGAADPKPDHRGQLHELS